MLGVAILVLGLEEASLLKAIVFSIANAIGFGLALIIFASIRKHLDLIDVPKGMQAVPIDLLVAGLLSLALMDFVSVV